MFAYRSILREPVRPAVIRESRRAPWLAVSVVCFGALGIQAAAQSVGLALGPTLLGISAASGLSLPPWLTALLAAVAVAGAGAFIWREVRARHPLIPVWLLRSAPVALALAGAACGYLTLFGPLVLIPQVLPGGADSAARTGLLLSALPFGFGLAALSGDLVLPTGWGDRRRGLVGATLACAVLYGSAFVPLTRATVIPELALTGLGLGIFVPANNTVIMRGTADSSASLVGGLVSMARGIGTTLGISLMALALHIGSHSSQAGNHGYAWAQQARPAFIALAAVAATAAAIALAGRGRHAAR